MRDDRKFFTQGKHLRPSVILGRERNANAFLWVNVERRDLTQLNIYIENNRFDSICIVMNDLRVNPAGIRIDLARQMTRQILRVRNYERIDPYAVACGSEKGISQGRQLWARADLPLRSGQLNSSFSALPSSQ